MGKDDATYSHALRFEIFTSLYDPWSPGLPEKTFKRALIRQAGSAQIRRSGPRLRDLYADPDDQRGSSRHGYHRARRGREGPLPSEEEGVKDGNGATAGPGAVVRAPYEDAVFDRIVSSFLFHTSPGEQAADAGGGDARPQAGGELHIADWGLPPIS